MRQAVRIGNLCLRFGEQAILHDIQLSAPQNSITVLAGRSGCGKSTLLRTMNRFNEEYGPCATRGLVQVDIGHGLQTVDDDAGVLDIPLQTLRQKVAMVFQTPQLLPVGIARNISMPLELALGLSRKQSAARVQAALELVGLWDEVRDRLATAASHLSGGQQQRLCLARALALEPRILLLDEPTGSLDIRAAAAIEALLLRLKQQYTIILVSHSVEQSCRLADQIIVMERGRIKARIDHDARRCAPELTRLIEG